MVLTALWSLSVMLRNKKKTPSLDSKNKEIKRLLENLNKFKKSPLRKSENKSGKDFLKKERRRSLP